MNQDGRLRSAFEKICQDHGIDMHVGRSAIADFIKHLHETNFKLRHPEGSLLKQVYWVLGDEAAYHFGCLLRDHGDEEAVTELQYMDPDMKRFRTTVSRWEFELQREIDSEK
jgi:hypothetical protein